MEVNWIWLAIACASTLFVGFVLGCIVMKAYIEWNEEPLFVWHPNKGTKLDNPPQGGSGVPKKGDQQ